MAKSDQRTRLTKMLIRKAFTEVLREKPVQNITVKELCQTAGINRGTFYSHYTDIYDLLQQIEDEITEEFQKSLQPLLEGDPSDLTPLNITAGVFACIQQNADVCAIALRPDGDRRFASQLLKIGREQCMASYRKYFSNVSAKKIAYFYAFASSGCIGLLEQWVAGGMEESAQELAKAAETLMMSGIGYLQKETPGNPWHRVPGRSMHPAPGNALPLPGIM